MTTPLIALAPVRISQPLPRFASDTGSPIHTPSFVVSSDSVPVIHSEEAPTEFSARRAFGHFIGGIINPFILAIQHPIKTTALIVGTIALNSIAPITLPLALIAGAVVGGAQLGIGVVEAVSNYRKQDYARAEFAFSRMGEGLFGVLGSLLGVRHSATMVAEAKVVTPLLAEAKTATQHLEAIDQGLNAAVAIRKSGWLANVKEVLSIVTTSEGRQLLASQLHPEVLVGKIGNAWQEMVRMTKEAPVLDLEASITRAQKALGIPNEKMPNVVPELTTTVDVMNPITGASRHKVTHNGVLGYYVPQNHTFYTQPNGFEWFKSFISGGRSYIAKPMDNLPTPVKNLLGNLILKRLNFQNTVHHELTHARQCLPIQEITREQAAAHLAKRPSIIPEVTDPKRNTELTKQLLDIFRFAKTDKNLGTDDLTASLGALDVMVDGLIANASARARIKGYLLSAAESEARLLPAQLEKQELMAVLDAGELAPAVRTSTSEQLRQRVIEERLNTLVEGLRIAEKDPLKVAQATSLSHDISNLSFVYRPGKGTAPLGRQFAQQEGYYGILQRLWPHARSPHTVATVSGSTQGLIYPSRTEQTRGPKNITVGPADPISSETDRLIKATLIPAAVRWLRILTGDD